MCMIVWHVILSTESSYTCSCDMHYIIRFYKSNRNFNDIHTDIYAKISVSITQKFYFNILFNIKGPSLYLHPIYLQRLEKGSSSEYPYDVIH